MRKDMLKPGLSIEDVEDMLQTDIPVLVLDDEVRDAITEHQKVMEEIGCRMIDTDGAKGRQ